MTDTAVERHMTVAGGSARLSARVAGALWLVVIVTGIVAEMFVRANLFVRNDGAATSAHIFAHQDLYRWGVVCDLTAAACYLAVVAVLYDLLKPVGRRLSTVAAAFGVAGSAVSALNMLAFFAPLIILTNADHLVGFTTQQLQSLVLLQVKLYSFGTNISLIFFSGVYLLMVGVLVIRSTFLPALLGALLFVAGACYLVGSVSSFIAPDLAHSLGVFIYLPGGIAEISTAIWLLVVGLNSKRWQSRVAEAYGLRRNL